MNKKARRLNDDDFPSHNETLGFIEKLNSENWEEFDGLDSGKYIKEIHQRITGISKMLSAYLLIGPNEMANHFKFFRVRKTSEIKNKFLRSEFSYPPATFSNSNLRANLKGCPVFYASDHPTVALLEYLQQWEDPSKYVETEFVISRWKMNHPHKIVMAPFIPKTVQNVNEYTVLSQFTNDEFRKRVGVELNDDKINGLREMHEYFSNLFINDKNRTISSYIGHYYLYYMAPLITTLFIFPSKMAKHGKLNFAIHPNVVDERMEISHIYRVKVKSIRDFGKKGMEFNFDIVNDFGVNENTRIVWSPINEVSDYFQENFKKDWGQEFNMPNSGSM